MGLNLLARWLGSLTTFQVTLMPNTLHELVYRRLQIHDQQAEKQKKNPLQKALVFSRRAVELQLQDSISRKWISKRQR